MSNPHKSFGYQARKAKAERQEQVAIIFLIVESDLDTSFSQAFKQGMARRPVSQLEREIGAPLPEIMEALHASVRAAE